MGTRMNRLILSGALMILGLFLLIGALSQLFSHDMMVMFYIGIGGAASLALGWYLIRRQFHLW
jgi:uncharacterized membrane-anchored protein